MAVYEFVEATGTVVPDTADLLATVNAEFQSIFGADFVVDPETPGGAWIAGEVSSRASVARNNATVANQINPNLAGGPFLDAVWALTGGARGAAARSTVQVTLTGQVGTPIPAGSRVQTAAGALFRLVTAATIPSGGTLTASFESVELGPVAAAAGTLTQIVDGVLGWDTATNPSTAVLGRATETDPASRARRRETLALQGQSTALAVSSRVRAVDGVRSVAFRENVTNATAVIDGITLVAHSVWVAVQGGADLAVATALLEAKSAGANWNGTTSVNVTEPASGQTFAVQFQRPTEREILARVTVRQEAASSTDPTTAVRDAIVNYANGDLSNEAGFVLGEDVSPYELAGAVNREAPEIFVTNVEIAFDAMTPVFGTATLAIALNEVATIERSAIQVLTA